MPLKQVIWDITGECNLKCKHCYAANKYQIHNRKDLNYDEAILTIDKIHKSGCRHITLLGGEPLLRKDIVDLVQYANTLEISIGIITNGHLLNEELIRKLVNLNITQITVSFEGISAKSHDYIRGNGSFESAKTGLNLLGKIIKEEQSDTMVGIGFTLTRHGLNDLDNLMQFALENNSNILSVDYLSVDGNAVDHRDDICISVEEHIDGLEKLCEISSRNIPDDFILKMNIKPKLKKYLNMKYGMQIRSSHLGTDCPGAEKSILIENDGVVTPCGIYNKYEKVKVLIENDKCVDEKIYINDYNDIEEIYKSDLFNKFIKLKNEFFNKLDTCVNCGYNMSCQPCPIEMYESKNVTECEIAKSKMDTWKQKSLSSIIHIEKDLDKLKVNSIGRIIIDRIKKKETLKDICNYIVTSTGVEKTKVEEDLIEFIYPLVSYRYISFPE